MKFFEEHFTRHQFFHAPHKWFFALLLSPIHAAEMRYKNVYHLNFLHARKLFIFDMTLLLSTIVIGGAAMFWFLYDPTITDLVELTLTPTAGINEDGVFRIKSGESVTYTVTYINKSDVPLENPTLQFELPPGFIGKTAEPKTEYNSDRHIFTLPNLPAQSSGEVKVSGLLFGQPDKEEKVTATLSYEQPERDAREQKRISALVTPRGSILDMTAPIPTAVLAKGRVPIEITLTNTSDVDPIEHILVPFQIDEGIRLEASTSTFELTANGWNIPVLLPKKSVVIEGFLTTDIAEAIESKSMTLAPIVNVNEHAFPQEPIEHTLIVIRPSLSLASMWKDAGGNAEPGDTRELTLTMTNTSKAHFENLSVSFPLLSSIIDTARLKQLTKGRVVGTSFVIDQKQSDTLAQLEPQKTATVTLHIPIRLAPEGGTDLKFLLPIEVSAKVTDVVGATYTTRTEPAALAIGTHLGLKAELLYYTAEGDQLGRGPLPPEVGRETKYWMSIVLSNGTSRVSDVRVSATLAPGIKPTGKSSVSIGNNVSYDPGTRTISWTHSGLGAYQQTGIYFEVSFTPTEAQRGKTPIVIERINASGYDSYIGTPIAISLPALDISIPTDSLGRRKGITVR